MTNDEITTDEYFGGCPECGENNGYLNVNRSHWSVCDAHRTKWLIGENLFSAWRDETEAEWQRNEERLAIGGSPSRGSRRSSRRPLCKSNWRPSKRKPR